MILTLSYTFHSTGCRDGTSKDVLLKEVEKVGLPAGSVEWINLDMSSMDSVRSFAQTILNKNVPISVLINNGMISINSLFGMTQLYI